MNLSIINNLIIALSFLLLLSSFIYRISKKNKKITIILFILFVLHLFYEQNIIFYISGLQNYISFTSFYLICLFSYNSFSRLENCNKTNKILWILIFILGLINFINIFLGELSFIYTSMFMERTSMIIIFSCFMLFCIIGKEKLMLASFALYIVLGGIPSNLWHILIDPFIFFFSIYKIFDDKDCM